MARYKTEKLKLQYVKIRQKLQCKYLHSVNISKLYYTEFSNVRAIPRSKVLLSYIYVWATTCIFVLQPSSHNKNYNTLQKQRHGTKHGQLYQKSDSKLTKNYSEYQLVHLFVHLITCMLSYDRYYQYRIMFLNLSYSYKYKAKQHR